MLDERSVANGGGVPGPALELTEAAWLGPSALILVAPLPVSGAEPAALDCEVAGPTRPASRAIRLDGSAAVVVTAPRLEDWLADGGRLEVRLGEAAASLDPPVFAELETDLQTIVRHHLAPLDAARRARVVEFLARTGADVPEPEQRALAERLHAVRDVLRERVPSYVVSESHPEGLHADRILVVDDRSFYIEGWIHDKDGTVTRITAISPEGARAELLGRKYRYRREDVESLFAGQADGAQQPQHGFLCFVELDSPSLLSDGWLLEMETASGDAFEVDAPPVTRDATTVRDAILNGPELHKLPEDELMANHVYPAITRVQARIGEPAVDRVVQFGDAPSAPDVSIVVPIYKRLDHLEMQLAEFVRDPEISGADLIYVLDSPEQAEELLYTAAQLTPLYRVPFRVIVLEQNAGFGPANNIGASFGRGQTLLMLNSDILPDEPGWLSRMRDFYESVPHIGALGAKLLYEDDSIQHAGMYFYKPPGAEVWADAHYFKGMHRSLPAANVPRSVPLVSGACLMIDRALFDELGGFRSIYVRGDYEDSDLCLQLMDSGRENWYLPSVELYHLEAQSYSVTGDQTGERYTANRYNAWVHSHLWSDRIDELMRAHPEWSRAAASLALDAS